MSDDWQVGDLAVCVDASDRNGFGLQGPKRLKQGAAYRVRAITPPGEWRGGSRCAGLVLVGPKNSSPLGDWHPERFRKIRPDEQEACEPEFITLLKRIKVPALTSQVT